MVPHASVPTQVNAHINTHTQVSASTQAAGGLVPVCGHAGLQAVLAHTPRGPVTVRQWLRDVRRLLASLPAASKHIVNICEDRYHFLLGLGACLLSGRVSLQPSSLTPAVWAQLLEQAPDLVCVHDGALPDWPDSPASSPIPCLHAGECVHGASAQAQDAMADDETIPRIPAAQVVAQVFTSGSTGVPVGHAKTWGKLCCNVRAEAQLLGLPDFSQQGGADAAPWCLVGTVPSQHMYGFESVILQALVTGNSLWSGRPFYPADVADALAAAPQPRMLVTTPVHLKVLLEAGVAFARVDRILCATAPLALELAQKAEAAWQAPLFEIYGSTETGQIAVRQPTQDAAWTLFPGVALAVEGDAVIASGGHLEGRIPLSDVVELLDARRFALLGRAADMVNIAGKRSSLAYLNSVLARITAVQDGAFFLPKAHASTKGQGDMPDSVQRLCLVACAPGVQADTLMHMLRQHIDAVFLPRPLILLEQLPRNATGKLPQAALQAVYEQHMAQQQKGMAPAADACDRSAKSASSAHLSGATAQPQAVCQRWQVPLNHPACDGHFPGHPVLPGAVLLQHSLDVCRSQWPHACGRWQAPSVKFLQTCHPGDVLDFVVEPKPALANAAQQAWAVRVLRGQDVVMSATLQTAGDAESASQP